MKKSEDDKDQLKNFDELIDREESIQEVSYKYNIGFQEMVDFYGSASHSEINQMRKYIENNNWNNFKKLIKKVIGVSLKG